MNVPLSVAFSRLNIVFLTRAKCKQLKATAIMPQIEGPSGYMRAQYKRMVEGELSTEQLLQAKETLYYSDERYINVRDELSSIERGIERFERMKSAGAEKIYSAV